MLLQIFGQPGALRHEFGHLGECGGVFLQKGEVGGAAADTVEKVEQARQGGFGAAAFGGGGHHARQHGVETLLGAGRQMPVAAAAADVRQPLGGFGRVGKAQVGQLRRPFGGCGIVLPQAGQRLFGLAFILFGAA